MTVPNTTYRVLVEKLGASDPAQFIGNEGEVFYDPDANPPVLKKSNGSTPGGVSFSGSGGSTTNNWTNPNDNVWSIVTHSGGFAGTFDGGDTQTPVLWFNKSAIATELGVNQYDVRGAIIDYHAYMSGGGHWGTIIGTIHWANDFGGNDNVTHIENVSGHPNLTHDVFWGKQNYDGLVYKSDLTVTQHFMIQWTARLFIGSEFAC